jgi:hypothetical protein
MDDFALADLASHKFREHVCIEGKQQFVVLAQLVAEDEANRNKLSRLASTFSGQALDRVEFRFQNERIHLHLHGHAGGQPPSGSSYNARVWRVRDLIIRRSGK